MQPGDQEELRRRAQEAMTRRRPTEAERTAQTEEAAPERPVNMPAPPAPSRPVETPRPQRPRQNQPQRPRPWQSEERRPPRRPRPLTQRSAEEGPPPERPAIPDTRAADEARARAERRRMADNEAPSVERHAAYRTGSSIQVQQLRRTLQNKHQIRQAILLNEILGPPVSLRKPGESGI